MVARRIASEEARQTMFPLPGIVDIAIEKVPDSETT